MFEILLERYKSLLRDINMGYPIEQEATNELMDLIVKMYYIYYSPDTSLAKEIKEYYE